MSSEIIDGPLGASSAEARQSKTSPVYHWEQTIDGITYALSTDKSRLNLRLFNQAFATEDVYWTGPMSDDAIKLMVENSCVLGLYRMKSKRLEANRNVQHNTIQIPEQIGFGRLVTDYSTLAYITDVWLSPDYQGKGLGKWMVGSMKEIVDSFPSLRRAILLTDPKSKGVKFYERELGMKMADIEKDKYGFMQYVPK